jgi:hypothetical protein
MEDVAALNSAPMSAPVNAAVSCRDAAIAGGRKIAFVSFGQPRAQAAGCRARWAAFVASIEEGP